MAPMETTRAPFTTAATTGVATPRILVLEGTPSRIGLAHGQLLKPNIQFLSEQMRRLIFRRVGPVRGPALWAVARCLAQAMYRHFPPHLKEELAGIVRGSGTPFSDILILNCLDDVLNVLRRLAPRTPIPAACSSFALWGNRTHDGGVLHGRNLDYHFRGTPIDDGGEVARLLLKQTTLFVYRPEGRAPFLSIGWPGLVGTATAINLEGIALGGLTSYLRGTSPNGMPATVLYRRIMEESRTLADAGGILRGARRTIGNNLLVSSGREGRAALFEITRDRVEELTSGDGVLVSTNHFTSPVLAGRQHGYRAAHSLPRWERMEALCRQTGATPGVLPPIGAAKDSGEATRNHAEPGRAQQEQVECGCPAIGPEGAMAILADTGCARPEYEANPLERIANLGTAISVVFQPGEMRLWLCTNPEPPASLGRWVEMDVRGMLGTAEGT